MYAAQKYTSTSATTAHRQLFVDLVVQKTRGLGSCSEWLAMVDSRLSTDLISYAATQVSLTRAVDLAADSPITHATNRCNHTLTGTTILKKLVQLSTNLATVGETSYECQGVIWRVGRCQPHNAPFICADCASSVCTSGVSTPSILYTSPCTGTDSEMFAEDTRLNVLQIDYEELSVAPTIQSLQWTASKNTVAVTVAVSEASGSMVCAGYLKSKSFVPSNANALALENGLMSIVISTPVFVLRNLIPAADYDIYCATFSPLGVALKTSLILATKTTATTQCCRSVNVQLIQSSFSSGEDTAQALIIAVGSVLPDNLTISLLATDSVGNTVQLFTPRHITFLSTSPQIVAYTAHAAGTYTLSFTLSGISAKSYEILYSPTKVVTVLSAELPPAPPRVIAALFTNDGTSVILHFDSPTDMGGLGGTFLCHQLLSFAGLLSSTRCQWSSDKTVSIFPTGIMTVSVGLEVTILSGVLKARCKTLLNGGPSCNKWDYMTRAIAHIEAPANPVIPTVSIVGPSHIGPCDKLPLDVTGSRGSGGRPFSSVIFVVEGLHGSTTALSTFINSHYKVDQVFEVPQEFMFAGFAYNIIVKICNFLGGCGQSSLYVVVSTSSNVPVVSINAKQTLIMNRFSPLTITGNAHVSTCNGTTTSSGLFYEWSLLQSAGLVPTVASSFTSISANPRTFKLPPFTLTVGATYVLTLTTRHVESFKYSSSSVQITVGQGAIVAVVSGGSERGVRLDGFVDIDASGSYDEDTLPGTTQALLYTFTCVQTSPSYKSPSDLLLSLSANTPAKVSITVPENGGSLLESVHVVTVTVQHRDDGRVTSKSIVVRVLPSNSPLITMQSESGLRINPTEKLKLLATIETAFPTSAQWSINDPSIILSEMSLSEIKKDIGITGLTSPRTFVLSLVLPPASLPQQSTFNFYMTCTSTTGHSASAAITISTNAPPLPGVYTVMPETGGVMLTTEFTFVALRWEDDDVPITYEFAYQSAAGSYLVHRSRTQVSFTTAPLPAGRDLLNFTLSTRLVVFDILNAQHAEYRNVQVLQEEMSAADKSAYLADALEASNGFPDEMKLAVATTSSIVNAVNCSTAPNCGSLNRESCSSKEGMCGPCSSGFVGESGHANSYCMSWSESHARKLRNVMSSEEGGLAPCDVDTDCSLPHWHLCINHQCVVRSKQCQKDCSGLGRCGFVSVYDANVSYTTCSVLNTHCRPRCICPPGRMGLACEVSLEDYEVTLETRHRLVQAIGDVSLQEDAARDTVVSWIESIAAICADSAGIADHTKVLMAELTAGFLVKARDLGLSYEMIASVGAILDLVMDVETNVLSTDQSMELLQAYTSFIANDIVPGQNSVELVNELFRSSVHAIDGQSAVTLATPKSALENLVGNTQRQQVELPKIGTGLALKVTLVETISKLDRGNGLFVGVPLGIRFSDSPCKSLESEPCKMTVILPILPDHQQDIISKEWEGRNHTLQCADDDVYTKIFSCPGGHSLTLACNGAAGVVTQRCPRSVYETYCSSIGDEDASTCELMARAPEYVMCECSVLASNRTRRRHLQEESEEDSATGGDQSEVSIDIVAAGRNTLKEFASTWRSAADLNSHTVVHSIQVLITVGGLAIIGIGAVCIAARLDYIEQKVKTIEETTTRRRLDSDHSTSPRGALESFQGVAPAPSVETQQLADLQRTKRMLTFRAAALRVKKQQQRQHKGKKLARHRAASVARIDQGTMQIHRLMKMEELRIDESLPMVMRPLPIWRKFLNEVQMHHRWIGIVCHYSPTYSRPIRILSLLINILIMLFVQSVTYNIADPDDGTCETFTDAKSCLAPQSSISSSESKCYWDVDSETCQYRPFNDNMERVIIVALFAAVVSAPFAIFFQSLIMFVLAADTERPASQIHRSSISVQSSSMGQPRSSRQSFRGRPTSMECANSVEGNAAPVMSKVSTLSASHLFDQTELFSDFNELFSRIKSYRQTLSLDEKKEFDHIWGFSNMINAENGEIEIDTEVRFSRILGICGQRPQQTHREKILLELGSVQRAVTREAARFDAASAIDNSKSKRLLFLFIKDLMDGVNGDIVDIKDRVDNAVKRRVPIWSKYATWAFLFIASMGMLFYIYLFAMKQSASRQQSWFTSFVVWLIFEILLVSSGLVLVKHIIIPLMVMGDLRRVKKQVVRDILKFKARAALGSHYREESPDDASNFNAAKYFFPSYKLALLLPSLPESKAILQYSTPYPKNALTKISKSVQKNYDMRFNFVSMLISRVLVFTITSMVSLPEPIQNMLLELVSSSGFGYVVILHIQLFRIHPVLAFFPVITVAIIVHFMTISGRATTRLDSLTPSASSLDKSSTTTPGKPPSAPVEETKSTNIDVEGGTENRARTLLPSRAVKLKTRRQSIMEGVAMVQHLAQTIEYDENNNTSSDNECNGRVQPEDDGNRFVEWEDGDEFDPDLEENEEVFQVPYVWEDDEYDLDDFCMELCAAVDGFTGGHSMDVNGPEYYNGSDNIRSGSRSEMPQRSLSESETTALSSELHLPWPGRSFSTSEVAIGAAGSPDVSLHVSSHDYGSVESDIDDYFTTAMVMEITGEDDDIASGRCY